MHQKKSHGVQKMTVVLPSQSETVKGLILLDDSVMNLLSENVALVIGKMHQKKSHGV